MFAALWRRRERPKTGFKRQQRGLNTGFTRQARRSSATKMRLLVVLCAGLAMLLIPSVAWAHTDMPKLRNVICKYETRGEADPDNALGKSDEVGRCQIRPGTASQAGYRGSLENLAKPQVNRFWALKILWLCRRELHTANIGRLAHCYNGGSESPWEPYGPSRRYAAAIWQRYRLQRGA